MYVIKLDNGYENSFKQYTKMGMLAIMNWFHSGWFGFIDQNWKNRLIFLINLTSEANNNVIFYTQNTEFILEKYSTLVHCSVFVELVWRIRPWFRDFSQYHKQSSMGN